MARRIGDTARGHGALAGRIGGDEFVVLAEVSPGLGGMIALAAGILGEVSRPISLRVGRVAISACAGIAECAAGSPASATLIADADAALYQAKSSGPGQVGGLRYRPRRRAVAGELTVMRPWRRGGRRRADVPGGRPDRSASRPLTFGATRLHAPWPPAMHPPGRGAPP